MLSSILFVCTGNTCRSVMAEGLMKKALAAEGMSGIRVSSAGTDAQPHYRIYGALLAMLEEKGIDVSSHRPTMVTRSLVEDNDVILAMEARHRSEILSLAPSCAGKVFMMTGYVDGKDRDIPDPIGQGEDVYRSTLAHIEGLVDRMVLKIKEEG